MSLQNLKASNKTILVSSIFVLITLVVLSLVAFKVIPSTILTVALFSGAFLALGSLMLGIETWFEGAKPKLFGKSKDIGAWFSTIFSVIGMIGGIALMLGETIPPGLVVLMGIVYLVNAVLLANELAFD